MNRPRKVGLATRYFAAAFFALFTVFEIRDLRREAVFLWRTPLRTATSSSETAFDRRSPTFAASVSAVLRRFFTTFRTLVTTERLRARRRSLCAARFLACLVLAMEVR